MEKEFRTYLKTQPNSRGKILTDRTAEDYVIAIKKVIKAEDLGWFELGRKIDVIIGKYWPEREKDHGWVVSALKAYRRFYEDLILC